MKRAVNIFLVIAVSSFFLLACGKPAYLTEEELNQFVNEESNNLSKTISSDGYVIKVTYRPNDLLVAQEVKTMASPSTEIIESVRSKYKMHYYFVLSFSKDGKEVLNPGAQGLSGFSDLVQTLSFRMSDKVNMTTPNDTILVADYIFNRTFGMSPSTDLLFVFDKKKRLDRNTSH